MSTSTGVLSPRSRSAARISRPLRPGQAEIEQDDVEGLGGDAEEGAFAGALDDHVVVLALEPFAESVGDFLFVFDDEHAHAGTLEF